jgi:hypothetical protein
VSISVTQCTSEYVQYVYIKKKEKRERRGKQLRDVSKLAERGKLLSEEQNEKKKYCENKV